MKTRQAFLKQNLPKLLLMCLIAFLLAQPVQVLAISAEQRKVIDSGAHYFNVDVTRFCTSAPTQTTSATGKIFMIGDSITEGSQGELESTLSSRGFTPVVIDGLSSRRLSAGDTALDGLTVLENGGQQYQDAAVIVIALGTNGGITAANIQTALQTIKAANTNPETKIFWVNLGVNNAVRNEPLDVTGYNTTLSQNVSQGYTVIDWAAVVAQNPQFIDPNPDTGLGVHPIENGRQAFANAVANAATGGGLPTGCGGAPTTTCSAPGADLVSRAKVVWDFFIGKGLQPHMAAGFLGNMQAEASFEPRRTEYAFSDPPHLSDVVPPNVNEKGQPGYGIIQWTAPGRKQGLRDFADSSGRPHGDLCMQLDYVWVELSGAYKASTLDRVMASTTLEEATEIITRNYEIPAHIETAIRTRIGFARDWVIRFGSETPTPTGPQI